LFQLKSGQNRFASENSGRATAAHLAGLGLYASLY
jgi:hypothetical protein